ncbi:hypothetical protein AY601_1969 [Pedobacter cryoconitis]|uniref:Uncharacterized protein n=1 Tax=Pedobacter cryoconitis TaxID=188932 RepID=A0A127VC52_9SPHI|nr:class I lanthipeptide [Pedobacter cryoconitis]AMP98875.1 hypothetical protein AY601_1969 [Pedobacter cryoconitis]
MKKKGKNTDKSLSFEKTVIVSLGKKEMMKIRGGGKGANRIINTNDGDSGRTTCDTVQTTG